MKVKITRLAAQDIRNIDIYISQFNPVAAAGVIEHIRKIIKFIGDFPYASPQRDDIRAGFRARPAGNRLVIYSVDSDTVTIRAVYSFGQSFKDIAGR